MPVGAGADYKLVKSSELLEKIKEQHKSLRPYQKKIGNGPARYCEADDIKCKIGIIDAVSNCFCGSCSRIRLTSKGELKPCLAYKEGVDLKSLLKAGISDKELKEIMRETIYKKPKAHNFHHGQVYETRNMNQIGG
jgi:cyclic pyranopterin phosphate synthase